jgi:hypothetical protein
MPKAATVRQAKAAHATRDMKMGINASARAPVKIGTATCQCLSLALLAILANTCRAAQSSLSRFKERFRQRRPTPWAT